jgi:hypothetical protein
MIAATRSTRNSSNLTTSPLTISPTRITSQRFDRPRRWRRSRASGLAPEGHDQYPVLGAKNALLGRLRAVAGRLECHPPTRLVSENDFAASGPRETGARMVCPPTGRGIGLRPPAPALRRGPAGEPASLLRGTRIMPRAARPSHPPPTNIMNHNLISPDAKAVTPLYRVHGRREAGSRWVPI